MNIKHKSTLENFEKILKLRNYSNRSIEMYSHYVCKFIESFDKPALHITSKEIKDYLINYSYSSISQQNQIYSALKLYCKHILNIKFIDKIFLERPRKEKHLAIISLAYSVGLRVSEVCNIRIDDIDSKQMIINIRQAKGRKDRIVPLSPKMLELLRSYFKEYRPVEYLFNGQFGGKYSHESCNKIVKKYLGENYHFHLLRHASFSSLVDSGVDISVVQKLAGHESIKTTSVYLHTSKSTLNKLPLPI